MTTRKRDSRDRAALRRVVGNSAWLAAAETVARGSSFLAIVYLSRVLAPQGLGLVEFGLAVHAAMFVVATGGTDVLLTREGTRPTERLARLGGQNLSLGWVQLLPVLLAFLGVLVLLGRPTALVGGAAVFGLAAALAPLGMRFAFVAGERASVLGAGTVAGFLTYLGSCLVFVRTPDHAWRVAFAFVAAMAARHGLQLVIFARWHGRPVLELRDLASRIRPTVALGLGSVARGLMLCVDVLVIGLLRAPEDVASYGLATKVPLFLMSLAGFHYLALFPTLSRAIGAGDDRRAMSLQSTSIAATLGVALPGAICVAWAARDVVSVLFTDRFAAAGPLLVVLVWRFPLAAMGGGVRTALWASDAGRDARIAAAVLAVAVIGLPPAVAWGGPVGAATWMVACDVLALGAYARALRPGNRPAASGGQVARIGLAAVVAVGLLLMMPETRGVRTLVAALAVWAAAALVATLPYARQVVGAWRA